MFAVVVAFATFTLLAGSPAALANGYGHVEFVNSGSPSAQADFRDGMALLHDFEYESAAAAFRRAEAADPGFAMAYWGEAMTHNHPVWMEQDLESGRAALNKLAPTPAERRARAKTDREQAYLEAIEVLYGQGDKESRDLAYEAAMARLHDRYSGDVDAAAFYGLSILGTAHAGRDVATYMRAASVLEEAWMNHREHPGLVHYLIHSYDDPAHAPLGLRAARIYARIAPDAGHAQHMTSHIFVALGMWPEVVDANIAALAARDRARRAAGEEPVGCGHYQTFLMYAYLQLGQMEDAASAVSACSTSAESKAATEQPSLSMDPDNSLAGSFASMRLRYLLDTGNWSGGLAGRPLPLNAGPGAGLDFAFARAMGEIELKRIASARLAVGELEAAAHQVVDIETKGGKSDPSYRIRAEILVLEARGLLAEQEQDPAAAELQLRQAVALEDTLPIAFGPPAIDKPTHELLGEFLLRHDRAADARQEFEKALARTPGRRLAERGYEAASAGTR